VTWDAVWPTHPPLLYILVEPLMSLIDTNKDHFDELPISPLVELKAPIPTTRLADLSVQSVSGVSLFVLTLFIPIESTLNIAYTLPVNHRLVDQAHLRDANGHDTSIAEAIYKDATCKYFTKCPLDTYRHG
jgi:hypothetical protein